MVSVCPQWWQPVGGPRDKIWNLVALVWPIRSRVITTSSALVRCWNFLAVTCFGLKINELPSCIAKDIFKALFVYDLAICFRGRSLNTIERLLQQAMNAIQEWATRDGFRFAAHKCKVMHFTALRSRAERPPIVRMSPRNSLGCGGLAPLI